MSTFFKKLGTWLGIHKYQDQIQEFCGLDTQPIKDALETLGPYLGEAKNKILAFLVFMPLGLH